jgi:putative ABC transport system permease protein
LRPIDPPREGITLNKRLAERLEVGTGDIITVEVMEGRRHHRDVPVAAIVEEMLGMCAYMDIGSLNELTGEGDVVRPQPCSSSLQPLGRSPSDSRTFR